MQALLNVLLCENLGQFDSPLHLLITMRMFQVDVGGRARARHPQLAASTVVLHHRPGRQEAPHRHCTFQSRPIFQQPRESVRLLTHRHQVMRYLENMPRRLDGSMDWLLPVGLKLRIMSLTCSILLYSRVMTTWRVCAQRTYYPALRFSYPGLERHGRMPAKMLKKTIKLMTVLVDW